LAGGGTVQNGRVVSHDRRKCHSRWCAATETHATQANNTKKVAAANLIVFSKPNVPVQRPGDGRTLAQLRIATPAGQLGFIGRALDTIWISAAGAVAEIA